MAPGRGITVYPGAAVDYSALARPAMKTSSLSRRAGEWITTTWGITALILAALTVVGGIFCAIVVVCMLKTQRERKKRLQQTEHHLPTRKHQYQVLEDMESEPYRGVSELSDERQVGEMQSEANEVPRVHQLDGFVAPVGPAFHTSQAPANVEKPKPSAHPVELSSETRTIMTKTYR